MSDTKTDPASPTGTLPPVESPLMTFEDAATYFHLTTLAFKKLIEREANPLADGLRACVYVASERRRYIKRKPFFSLLRTVSS